MNINQTELVRHIMNNATVRSRIMKAANNDDRIALVMGIAEELQLPIEKRSVTNFFAKGSDCELNDSELETVVGGKVSQWGTDGDDELTGTTFYYIFDGQEYDNADVIEAGAGNDSVSGLGGNDTLDGGTGNDTLDGGSGKDNLIGGEGDDVMSGGSGRDILDGGEGNDTMNGGEQADILIGGSGSDTMDGGEGNDIMDGGTGSDDMDGGSGNDVMVGGYGNDYMDGGSGNDILLGEAGADNIKGGEGNDLLAGGEGNDTLSGGEGNDTLLGGAGNDILVGGLGNDVFIFGSNDGTDTIAGFRPDGDSLNLLGADSIDDITVTTTDGDTVIIYGDTTITLSGVEMTAEEVWARVQQ